MHLTLSRLLPLSLLICCCSVPMTSVNAENMAQEIAHFPAKEAVQGVAVDDKHFYAVTNSAIGKYDLKSGERTAQWKSTREIPLVHLNSGVVIKDRLYCAHSNWPRVPLKNTIEVWETGSLEHVETIKLKTVDGAMNWVDQWEGSWFGVFAHYLHGDDPDAPGHVSQTRLVKFDEDWNILQTWYFPAQVWKRFAPVSNSGGCFAADGTIYCTGHDHAELYHLRLPEKGSVLEYIETVPAPITGQGIAWQQKSADQLWGIRRSQREVVQMKLMNKTDSSAESM